MDSSSRSAVDFELFVRSDVAYATGLSFIQDFYCRLPATCAAPACPGPDCCEVGTWKIFAPFVAKAFQSQRSTG
jgi:hypothetical protein